MLVYWRGRGWSVLLIMFGWIFVAVGVGIATQGPEADPNANANVDRLFGIAFALSAASVFFVARGRRLPPQTVEEAAREPRPYSYLDHFMFVPMLYYAYIFAGAAVWMIGKSFFV